MNNQDDWSGVLVAPDHRGQLGSSQSAFTETISQFLGLWWGTLLVKQANLQPRPWVQFETVTNGRPCSPNVYQWASVFTECVPENYSNSTLSCFVLFIDSGCFFMWLSIFYFRVSTRVTSRLYRILTSIEGTPMRLHSVAQTLTTLKQW